MFLLDLTMTLSSYLLLDKVNHSRKGKDWTEVGWARGGPAPALALTLAVHQKKCAHPSLQVFPNEALYSPDSSFGR